jgi:amidohydrolase
MILVPGQNDRAMTTTEPDRSQRLARAVQAHRAEILDLGHRIHGHPEPGFEEHQASAWVAETLVRHGYIVERPAGSLATAIRARLTGGAGAGPTIAILVEYDALRGLGHGCGHNIISAAGVGAAIALAAIRETLPGTVLLMGTPAEEDLAGKQIMIDDGLFEGVDAALMVHASDETQVAVTFLASMDAEVTFTGVQAHASTDPWRGRNALDALVLLFTSIGLWRQQLRTDARVHGIITDGGAMVNVIPGRAVGHVRLRSPDDAYHEQMRERFTAMVGAAAQATGTRSSVRWFAHARTMRNSQAMGARFGAHLSAAGMEDRPVSPPLGSSDIGNVSMTVPTIHPMLAIADTDVPLHSEAFRELAATTRADEVALIGATCLAQTAADLLADPELVAAAWREFRAAAAADVR